MMASTPGDRQQSNKLRTVRTPQDFSIRRNRNTKTPIASANKRKPAMKSSISSKKEPIESTLNDSGNVIVLV